MFQLKPDQWLSVQYIVMGIYCHIRKDRHNDGRRLFALESSLSDNYLHVIDRYLDTRV